MWKQIHVFRTNSTVFINLIENSSKILDVLGLTTSIINKNYNRIQIDASIDSMHKKMNRSSLNILLFIQ